MVLLLWAQGYMNELNYASEITRGKNRDLSAVLYACRAFRVVFLRHRVQFLSGVAAISLAHDVSALGIRRFVRSGMTLSRKGK
jgi:hypothetical protein